MKKKKNNSYSFNSFWTVSAQETEKQSPSLLGYIETITVMILENQTIM
jgi:hypothetical protein